MRVVPSARTSARAALAVAASAALTLGLATSASATADPAGTHEASLVAACRRVRAAVDALTVRREGSRRRRSGARRQAGNRGALAHPLNLERALGGLASPLGRAAGSRLASP